MHGEDVWTAKTFHTRDGLELHFRFIGKVDGREFIVNVQFPAAHEQTGDWLQPQEYEFTLATIIQFVLTQTGAVAETIH